MTKLVVVCADLPAPTSTGSEVDVVGGTEQLVILERGGERFACHRDTGELLALPVDFVATQDSPIEVSVAGGRVALRRNPAAVVRGGERLAVARTLENSDHAALVPGVGAFALVRILKPWPTLVPIVIRATGKLVSLSSLPVWVVNERDPYDLEPTIGWRIVYEPTTRVIVITTPTRASWLSAETVDTLGDSRERKVEVEVARAPALPKPIEFFRADRELSYDDGEDDIAATTFTPAIADRIERLRTLGIVPTLSNDQAAEIAAKVARQLGDAAPADAGTIIATYRATVGGTDDIAGPRSAERAARANAQLAHVGNSQRFVSFEAFNLSFESAHAEPTFLRLSPEARAEIETDELLWLDPEPSPLPELENGAELATVLVDLGGLSSASVAATSERDHVRIRLRLDAALDLIACLPSKTDLVLRADRK